MSSRRRKKIRLEDSSGAGILGWMETQEQANIVARQLQSISHSDRCSAGHMHADVVKIVLELLLASDSSRILVRGAARD